MPKFYMLLNLIGLFCIHSVYTSTITIQKANYLHPSLLSTLFLGGSLLVALDFLHHKKLSHEHTKNKYNNMLHQFTELKEKLNLVSTKTETIEIQENNKTITKEILQLSYFDNYNEQVKSLKNILLNLQQEILETNEKYKHLQIQVNNCLNIIHNNIALARIIRGIVIPPQLFGQNHLPQQN
jgi:hypothetical protein